VRPARRHTVWEDVPIPREGFRSQAGAARLTGDAGRPDVQRLVARFAERYHLSGRERLVVQWTAHGYSTKVTSNAMACEIATVNAYWLRIRHKTGFGSRLEVMARLLESALLAGKDHGPPDR
jgi:DNA-binding CsgD family transcriptional regulator